MSVAAQRTAVAPSAPTITGDLDLNNAFHILPKSLHPWRPAILSYTASLFSTSAGFPLDSVKTRMQSHYYKGIYDCVSQTVRNEGFKGFFRGLTAPLVSSSITRALGVSCYTTTKPYASLVQQYTIPALIPEENASARYRATILALNNAPVSFSAGVISGASCSIFACPFEFTKLFQQLYIVMQSELGLNPRRMPKTTYQVARQIKRSEGIAGLYSGFKFHLLRDAIGSGLYFSIYETAKILIDGFVADQHGMISGTNIPIGTVSITTAGALSGVFSWILVFPIDTVKSLTQRDIVSNIIRGLALKQPKSILDRPLTWPTKRMYRGLSVSITRSVITSIAFFSSFEYLMKYVA